MIKYLFLLVLAFLVEGCYTVFLKPNPSPAMFRPYKCQTVAEFNALGTSWNIDLIGQWENRTIWMDGGEEIRRLEFNPNGKLRYFSHFEEANSPYSGGEFRTVSDTMIVCFEDREYLEYYRFKVNAKSLSLSSLNQTKNIPLSINEKDWYRYTE